MPLTQNYYAVIDESDYDDLIHFKWSLFETPWGNYAKRFWQENDRLKFEYMHRRLLPGSERVDHRNGDGLDNRRANLRPATNSQNGYNRKGLNSNNTSGLIGVSWSRQHNRWSSYIYIPSESGGNGKKKHLGLFIDPIEAAIARDEAAKKYHGEFVTLNFPELSE